MAKRRRSHGEEESYAGMSKDEWEDWGEKFGKRMERWGEGFGKKWERRGKRWEKRWGKKVDERWGGWWFSSLGFLGPLIGSIIGIIFLGIGILVLNFFNVLLDSTFIARLSHFLFVNLPLFFAAFMFFGYSDYFSKRFRREFWIVAPITTAIGIAIVIWVGVWLLNQVNWIVDSTFIARVANFLSVNLLPIFVVLLVLGYVISIAIKIFMMAMRD